MDFRKRDLGRCPFSFYLFLKQMEIGRRILDVWQVLGNLERERYLLEKEIFVIENSQSKRKERMVEEEILDIDI